MTALFNGDIRERLLKHIHRVWPQNPENNDWSALAHTAIIMFNEMRGQYVLPPVTLTSYLLFFVS